MNTTVRARASPDRPIVDTPRSIRVHPMNCGFLVHRYTPVVMSFDVSCPVDLRKDRNSIIPIGKMTTPTTIAIKPPVKARPLLTGISQTEQSDAKTTGR